MSALTQYIDLYDIHKGLIDNGSATVVNAKRPEALKALMEMELPKAGSENYELTDLERMLAPDYGLNLTRKPFGVDPSASFRCGVPTLTPSLYFQINDLYGQTDGAGSDLPDGVWIGSLRNFADKFPDDAARFYGSAASLENPIVALNTLLVQDGIVVKVNAGVKVEKPIQIVNILNGSQPMMAVRRLLIIVGDEAEVKILSCDHTQTQNVGFLTLQTIEIFAGERSLVDFYDLEESSEFTNRLSALYLRQGASSNVMLDGITLYNGVTRNEYYTRFEGDDASLRLYGMGIEDHSRELSTYSLVEHKTKGCHTDELFKYVVDDEARGYFGGLVKVEKGASKTEAYQSNRNIVGSDSARMYSKPQLEIYDDDVKCSHGTATGQLDGLQVFYMRTRGLSEETAKLMLKQAFMADVIDGVRLTGLKERLQMLVEKRFSGCESSCSACQGC